MTLWNFVISKNSFQAKFKNLKEDFYYKFGDISIKFYKNAFIMPGTESQKNI
jgi:hypothetical protein